MTLHNVLVQVGDDAGSDARTTSACELARSHGADVTGIYVKPYPVIIPAAPIGGAAPIVEGLAEVYDQACREARGRFEAAAAKAGVTAAWHTDDGDLAERVAAHARYADLAVVGQWSPDDLPERQPRDLGGLVALTSGGPVLVLPCKGRHPLAMARVMLCWDGTREAARAARDMVALLPRGAHVDVAVVDPEDASGRDPGADIARLLAAHGLDVEVRRLSSGDRSVANTLLAASADLGSDLVVMGAYGHARMREIAFGGTTRAMLAHASLPILLSH